MSAVLTSCPHASNKSTYIVANRVLKKCVKNHAQKHIKELAKKTRKQLIRIITKLNGPASTLRHVKQNYTQFMVNANVLNKKDMDAYATYIHNSTTKNLLKHITKVNENIRKNQGI
jgi:hypothetical protein